MSIPVVFSIPSSHGDAFTSITNGPRLARRISHSNVQRHRSRGFYRDFTPCGVILATCRAAAMQVERKSPSFMLRSIPQRLLHRQQPDSGYRARLRSFDIFTRICAFRPRKASITLPPPDCVIPQLTTRQFLRAFNQLDHQRRTADHVVKSLSIIRRMRNARDRQVDALTRQQLHGTQFVTRPGNGDRLVLSEIAPQHLELAQSRRPIKVMAVPIRGITASNGVTCAFVGE